MMLWVLPVPNLQDKMLRLDLIQPLGEGIARVCSEIPCSSVLHFLETNNFLFIVIQLTGCYMMQDLVEENLGRDYK